MFVVNNILNSFLSDAGIRIWAAGIVVGLFNGILTYLFSRTSKSKIEMLKSIKELEVSNQSSAIKTELMILASYKMADLINYENKVRTYKQIFFAFKSLVTILLLSAIFTTALWFMGGWAIATSNMALFTAEGLWNDIIVICYVFFSWCIPIMVGPFTLAIMIKWSSKKPYITDFVSEDVYKYLEIPRQKDLTNNIFFIDKFPAKIRTIHFSSEEKISVNMGRLKNILISTLIYTPAALISLWCIYEWNSFIVYINQAYINTPNFSWVYFWGFVFGIGLLAFYFAQGVFVSKNAMTWKLLTENLKKSSL